MCLKYNYYITCLRSHLYRKVTSLKWPTSNLCIQTFVHWHICTLIELFNCPHCIVRQRWNIVWPEDSPLRKYVGSTIYTWIENLCILMNSSITIELWPWPSVYITVYCTINPNHSALISCWVWLFQEKVIKQCYNPCTL